MPPAMSVRLRAAKGALDASIVQIDLAKTSDDVALSTTTTLSGTQDTRLLPSAVASTTATTNYFLTAPVSFAVAAPPNALHTATKTVANETYQTVQLQLGGGVSAFVPAQTQATLTWQGTLGRWAVVANGQALNVVPPRDITSLVGYTASASSTSSISPSGAFDLTSNTVWRSLSSSTQLQYNSNTGVHIGTAYTLGTDGSNYAGEWLQLDTPSAFSLAGYRITKTPYSLTTPVSWNLFGANNTGGPWTRLHTVENAGFPAVYRSAAYSLSPTMPPPFTSYRFAFHRVYADGRVPSVQIEDVAFYPASSNVSLAARARSQLRFNSRPTATVVTNPFMQSNCAALYSTRLLNRQYKGPVVRVRRPEDSAELDFYADKYGGLKSATGSNLAAWLQGGALGKVAALYDQSVYGLHLASNAGTTDVDIVPTPWVSNLAYVVPAASNYAYPPSALSALLYTVSGQPYGNGTYSISQSSSISTANGRSVFDNAASFWQTLTGTYDTTTGLYAGTESLAGINGEWIRLDMPEALQLYNYTITPRNNVINTVPKEFKILGSSNNGQSWTVIDDVIATNYTVNVERNFNVATPTNDFYSSLAIIVTRVGNEAQVNRNRVNISELVFYGRPRLAVPLSPPAYKTFNSDWVLQCRKGKALTRTALPVSTATYEPVSFYVRAAPQFAGAGGALNTTTNPQFAWYVPSAATGVGFYGDVNNAPLGFGTVGPSHYSQFWVTSANRTDPVSVLLNTNNNTVATAFSASVNNVGATRQKYNNTQTLVIPNNQPVEIAGFDGQLQTLAIFNTATLSDAAGAALHQMHARA